MAIKIRTQDFPQKQREESIPQYFHRGINQHIYEDGLIETVEQRCEHISKAFGRLIETLAEKKRLSASEISYVVEGCYADDAEILTIED